MDFNVEYFVCWAGGGPAATWRVATDNMVQQRTCWWRPLAALQSVAATVGCWRNVWGGLFRGTQVLGQRPRATTPYRYSIITHHHSARLSHFGRRDRVAGARLSASLFAGAARTEVSEWQLFSGTRQWRPTFFCSCSPRLPADSHNATQTRWRSCRWRPWWVRPAFPVTAGSSAAAVNTIALDACDDSELFWPKGETRNLLSTFHDGRLAANPLHGETEAKAFSVWFFIHHQAA